MITHLSLDITETHDIKTLRVTDSSWYNKKIDVECATLTVTPPGTSREISFNVKKDFNTVLNSSNLKLKRARVYSDLGPLPDGVYKIRYSIKPNDDLWIEYEYLRVENLLKDFYEIKGKLKLQACEADWKTKDQLSKLDEIEVYIKAAKGEVEYLHNRKRGIELYDYARSLLSKFKQRDCLTC